MLWLLSCRHCVADVTAEMVCALPSKHVHNFATFGSLEPQLQHHALIVLSRG